MNQVSSRKYVLIFLSGFISLSVLFSSCVNKPKDQSLWLLTLLYLASGVSSAPTVTYTGSPYSLSKDVAMTTITPTVTGNTPTSCTSSPGLPTGLSIDATSCAISGTPTTVQGASEYTITASNSYGTGTAMVSIEVTSSTSTATSPTGTSTTGTSPTVTYTGSPYSLSKDVVMTTITPTVTGNTPTSCTSSPALPTGLSIDATSCAISGTPTTVQGATTYTIQATNSFGSGQTTVNITVISAIASFSTVSTLAGPAAGAGTDDGISGAASFYEPEGVATDGTNVFVADTRNHTIRKIVISTGVVTTLAGTAGSSGSADGTGTSASFYYPYGVTTDGTNVYVADTFNHTIRKIVISTGVVTTFAGTAGTSGTTNDTGTAARFNGPYGITSDGTNLYVADTDNHMIRKIVISTGVVTTIAGTGSSGSSDGTGTSASFNYPNGITTDGTNVYVADTNNHTIGKVVISTGVVTTVAGTTGSAGSVNATGTSASFYRPCGITTDGTNLYVADNNNYTVRKIVIATQAVTTFAGTTWSYGSTDGTGASARFSRLYGITMYGTNLYVTDTSNHTIRQIGIATQAVTTLAGTAGGYGSTNGTGTSARFRYPQGITSDWTNLYVADSVNHTIRKIEISTGVVTTLAGTAGSSGSADGTGTSASFYYPYGVTTDGTNLYVADKSNHTIRKIVISTGVVTTLAGTAGSAGTTDDTGTAARFNGPYAITTDGTNLYVADTANHTIRKIVISTGVVTTFAGTAGTSGSTDGTGTSASFYFPRGITTDGTNLYVSDTYNRTIRKIAISTAVVTTLAGSTLKTGDTDGTGTSARFNGNEGITTDGTNVCVADYNNHKIRQIVISTGVVTTLSGKTVLGTTDGNLTAAKFRSPAGILYISGALYVTDAENHNVRKIE